MDKQGIRGLRSWALIRWGLVASCLAVQARIFIPDYPFGTPLWKVLIWDANGWLHEAFYVAVAFLVLIDITYHWEARTHPKVFVLKKKA